MILLSYGLHVITIIINILQMISVFFIWWILSLQPKNDLYHSFTEILLNPQFYQVLFLCLIVLQLEQYYSKWIILHIHVFYIISDSGFLIYSYSIHSIDSTLFIYVQDNTLGIMFIAILRTRENLIHKIIMNFLYTIENEVIRADQMFHVILLKEFLCITHWIIITQTWLRKVKNSYGSIFLWNTPTEIT